MRQIFYSSPVDHRNLADWPGLAERLRKMMVKACPAGAGIETGEEPVFTYGTDVEETLLAQEDYRPAPRAVRLDLWCAIAHYGAIRLTLGDGIVRKERRALEKGLAKALRGETLVDETEEPFDRTNGRVYGYRLDPDDDRDRVTFSHLMSIFDPPRYVGERWLLQGEDEKIDEAAFIVSPKTPGPVAHFLAPVEAAEERVWRHATRGEGLIAVYDDDPGLEEIVRGFHHQDDLRRLGGRGWNYRVTLGRGRPEDSLMVTYDAAYPPMEEAQLLFVI